MGYNSTFRVNDDGSVTITDQLSKVEKDIIDIFQVEKSKGGVFACRRMKKRAMKYARSAKYPDFKVEKLMLDYFPNDLVNYSKTTWLIVLRVITAFFVLVTIFCLYGACIFVYEKGLAKESLYWLSAMFAFLLVCFLLLIQYKRISSKINKIKT